MYKIAQTDPFGKVTPPNEVLKLGGTAGIPTLVSVGLKTLIMGAAVYALFQFVLAGYAYISSAGDSKAIQTASAKIWHSVIGLTVAAGAFLIAGVVGWLVFKDFNAILQIKLFGL